MGVAGSGKSTLAAELATRLGWDLAEGDDLHPAASVAKMAAGVPLTDHDRVPWLAAVASWIAAQIAAGRPGVITCSALKRRYRDRLRGDGVVFVFLDPPRAVLADRLSSRQDHFMPASLLDSQLADLEAPGADEHAVRVGAGTAAEQAEQAEQVIALLGLPT